MKLTAVGWFLTHGVLGRGKAANYSVELQFPNQEKRTLPRITLNAYGTAIDPDHDRQECAARLLQRPRECGNGETIDGSFRVAEFKPPNFAVTASVAGNSCSRGETVAVRTTSTYLFGLTGCRRVDLLRDYALALTNYTWDKDTSYAFGRQWFWPENAPAVSSDVLQQTVPVDASGTRRSPCRWRPISRIR